MVICLEIVALGPIWYKNFDFLWKYENKGRLLNWINLFYNLKKYVFHLFLLFWLLKYDSKKFSDYFSEQNSEGMSS